MTELDRNDKDPQLEFQEATGDGFSIYRKIWHMLGLVFPFAFYLDIFSFLEESIPHASRSIGVVILLFGIVFAFILDIVRFRNQRINRIFFQLAGTLLKKTETLRFNGTLPYMVANLMLFAFFDYRLVVLGGIYLMIGDPAAAFFGERYGKTRLWAGKSLEGTLGFIGSSVLAGFAFLVFNMWFTDEPDSFYLMYRDGLQGLYPVFVVVVGALFASLAELFSPNTLFGLIDDNLLVPLVGAGGAAFVVVFFDRIPVNQVLFNPLQLIW